MVTASNTDNTAVLDGFTITAGNADGLVDNYEHVGGGIIINNGSPRLNHCIFTGNSATSAGGAIYNLSRAHPVLSQCIFSENTSDTGGAIHSYFSSTTLINCLLAGNSSSGSGGAISGYSSTNTLINCALTGNSTRYNGAAIYNSQSSFILTNCSLTGNAAGSNGGAIYNGDGSLVIKNCIIWNNTSFGDKTTVSSSIYDQSSFTNYSTNYSYCLFQNLTASNLDASNGSGNLDGTNPANDPLFTIPVDPETAPTASGLVTLHPDSPAINAGNNAFVTTSDDLAGFQRLVGTVDLGAYERQAVIHVDESASSGNNDGSSWADAFTGLSDALNTSSPGQEIWVAAGTYIPTQETIPSDTRSATFILKNNLTLYAGFPTGGGTFTTRDHRAHPTILSGDFRQDDGTTGDNSENAYHVLTGSGTDASAILNGFTITAGNANSFVDQHGGGGLYNDSGSPTLNSCTFLGNTSSRNGGAIENTASSPTLNHCIFAGNSGSMNGAAIYNFQSSPSLTNCALSGNEASFNGGAICNLISNPILINCTLTGNSATSYGGGIYNSNSSPIITNCIIWNNIAGRSTSSYDSSISNTDGFHPTYSYCLIQNYGQAELNSSSPDSGNNLHGLGTTNNPLFIAPIDPASAPNTLISGLSLQPGSPAINVGDNDANPSEIDLSGNLRFVNIIDLGAYERQALIHYVDQSAPDRPNRGTSWAAAFTELQSAFSIAAIDDEIWVAEGTYTPTEKTVASNDRSATFKLINGVAIYGGFPSGGGDGTFAARDADSRTTILSGDLLQDDLTTGDNSENAYHVLTGSYTDNTAILDGFTITSGNASGGTYISDGTGGGFYSYSGSPAISHCAFSNNTATHGGALYNTLSDGMLITGCSFSGNIAETGAAILNNRSAPEFINCTISGNTSQKGAVYNAEASPELTNCAIFGNSSSLNAGAIYNFDESSPVLVNCTISGNAATLQGGAIYNDNSDPALVNCIIWNNQDSSGTSTGTSSIFKDSVSTPNFSHCLIQNFNSSALNINGGGGNLDGTDSANTPPFLTPTDPATAPTSAGNLRVLLNSPTLGVGDGYTLTSANTSTTDLDGNSRFASAVAIIDLGCYAGGAGATFASTYPGLNPDEDANDNGYTNYADYAMGADPTGPHDPSVTATLVGNQLTFHRRANAADVFPTYYKSTDLITWQVMVEKSHYESETSTTIDGRTSTVLSIYDDPDKTAFFRQALAPEE